MSDEPAATLIDDHPWRAPHGSDKSTPRVARMCAFMNCGRPRSEHARVVSEKHRPKPDGAS